MNWSTWPGPDRQFRWIPVTTMSSGAILRLGMHEIIGAQPGPQLGVVATLHGDEPLSVEAVRRIVGRLDPMLLRGTVRIIPLGSPLGFESHSRSNVLDYLDVNRSFPGDGGTWPSQQIAATIRAELIDRSDVFIDIHSGDGKFCLDYIYMYNDEELPRYYGVSSLVRGKSFPGQACLYAARERGIPTMLIELGGGLVMDPQYLDRHVDGFLNCLMKLKMLPGDPATLGKYTVLNGVTMPFSKNGGMFEPGVRYVEIGNVVPKGTLLGRVYSPHTFEILEECTAPFAGTKLIMVRGSYGQVLPGDAISVVGDMATAEVIDASGRPIQQPQQAPSSNNGEYTPPEISSPLARV